MLCMNEMYFLLVVFGIVGMGLATFIVNKWLNTRKPQDKTTIFDDQKDRIKLLKEERNELMNEVKKFKQQASRLRSKEAPTVEGDPENLDLESTIKKLAPHFKEFLPKQFQDLADDPQILSTIAKLASEHEEEALAFIKQFVTKPRSDKIKSSAEAAGVDEATLAAIKAQGA